jgi:site-specific DNA recombinase
MLQPGRPKSETGAEERIMKLLRTAIYARHSAAMQNHSSSDDQAAACAEVVVRHGGIVVDTYVDPEISGYRRDRPGLKRLLADVRCGRIDMIVSEALDRLARDGEDISWLGKKLRFDHVRLVTSTEGEIDEVKLAVAGMLGSMFLTNLQRKTVRGLKAAVLAGRFAGGRAYGYRKVSTLDARGEPVRGVMEIVPHEADVVRRVCAEFAAGRSAIQIAKRLNLEHVPGPRGSQWNASTIRGDPKKLVGILNNPLYRGRLVWNRREWRKDPDSERRERRYRLRDPAEWIEIGVPELAVIDPALSAAVDAEFKSRARPDGGPRSEAMRRSVHLLSGLIVCGVCGANYTISGKDYYRCAGQKERGTCTNTVSVRTAPLEAVVLDSLKEDLLTLEMAGVFVSEFRREAKRLAQRRSVDEVLAAERVAAVEREVESLSANLLAGVVGPTIIRMLAEREAELAELRGRTSRVNGPGAVRLPSEEAIIGRFRRKVEDLQATLADPSMRGEAAAVLKCLMTTITISPGAGNGPEAELSASTARMIDYAANENSPRSAGAEGRSVTVVAGTGFEPVTFRL